MNSNEINIERSITKYTRRWIFTLKDIRKKAEKHTNREDIREYFLSWMQVHCIGTCLKYEFVHKAIYCAIQTNSHSTCKRNRN